MAFTPIWGTGFEMGSNPFVPAVTYGGNLSANTEFVHTGNYSQAIDGQNTWFKVNTPTLADYLDFGIWDWKRGGGTIDILAHLSDGNEIGVRLTGGGTIDAMINNSVVASSLITLPVSTWFNIQARIYINNTGSIQIRYEGGLVVDYTGDTQPASSATITCVMVRYRSNATNDCIDDFVIGSGGWPGDIRYEALRPNADTATHAWLTDGKSMQPTPAAPDVELTAGPGITGTYRYKVALIDPGGTTLCSPMSLSISPNNQTVHLTNLPMGLPDWTTNRKIYRTQNGGSTYYLCATIDDANSDYSDTLPDGSLGAGEPDNTHWNRVNESAPNDNNYLQIATNGAQDIHDLSAWWDDARTPQFVVQWSRLKKMTADLQGVKQVIKSGSTVDAGAALDLTTAWEYYNRILTVNPDTGIAWTGPDLDNLKIGVEAVVP